MKTEKFQRKPFIVECVQVTDENMADVAKWCNGTITSTDAKVAEQLKRPVKTWIQVDAQQPMNDRQCQAFVGDWVLYANHGFKIYTPKAFERTFEPVFQETSESKISKIQNAVLSGATVVMAGTPNPKSFAEQQKTRTVIRSTEEQVESA